MLQYERSDVSQGIDLSKSDKSKECIYVKFMSNFCEIFVKFVSNLSQIFVKFLVKLIDQMIFV